MAEQIFSRALLISSLFIFAVIALLVAKAPRLIRESNARSGMCLMYLPVFFFILLFSSEAFSAVYIRDPNQDSLMGQKGENLQPASSVIFIPSRTIQKSSSRAAGFRHRTVQESTTLTCGKNALCGTLDGDFDYVYGQVGLYYYHPDLKKNVFVAIYVKDADWSDDQYKIPKWDGKSFFLHVTPDGPPLWIQPMFMDKDSASCRGCKELMSGAVLYKKKGGDYSGYPYGAALSYLYLTVDRNHEVIDYSLDVYDEDDDLSEEYVTLEIGDEIQMAYVQDDSDESPEWDSVSLDNPVQVTREPTFEYAGYIPGRDYECAYCDKIDLPQTDVYFRLQAWETEDSEVPEWSEMTKLGKMIDNIDNSTPQGPCAFQASLENKQELRDLRRMRDALLGNFFGMLLASVYYKSTGDLTDILAHNAELTGRLKTLTGKNIHIARSLARGEQASVSASQVYEIIDFLYALREKAGPSLQGNIDFLIMGIQNEFLLKGLGISVK